MISNVVDHFQVVCTDSDFCNTVCVSIGGHKIEHFVPLAGGCDKLELFVFMFRIAVICVIGEIACPGEFAIPERCHLAGAFRVETAGGESQNMKLGHIVLVEIIVLQEIESNGLFNQIDSNLILAAHILLHSPELVERSIPVKSGRKSEGICFARFNQLHAAVAA